MIKFINSTSSLSEDIHFQRYIGSQSGVKSVKSGLKLGDTVRKEPSIDPNASMGKEYPETIKNITQQIQKRINSGKQKYTK